MVLICNRKTLLPLIALLLVHVHKSEALTSSDCTTNRYRDYRYNQISSGKCNSNTVVTKEECLAAATELEMTYTRLEEISNCMPLGCFEDRYYEGNWVLKFNTQASDGTAQDDNSVCNGNGYGSASATEQSICRNGHACVELPIWLVVSWWSSYRMH